jgi:hypothetical protein
MGNVYAGSMSSPTGPDNPNEKPVDTKYPSVRYNREGRTVTVNNAEEDAQLGDEWKHSPADFGVETHPGRIPDRDIAKNRPGKGR